MRISKEEPTTLIVVSNNFETYEVKVDKNETKKYFNT